MKRVILPMAIIIMTLLFLTIIGYVIYVFLSYNRIEDNLDLSISNIKMDKPAINQEYNLISWNIGFGAYSQDYSFFMDGGKYSRAYSKEETIKNTEGVYNEVQKYNPEFVINQEVDIKGTRSYDVNQVELLVKDRDVSYTYAQNYNSPYLFYPFNCPIGSAVSGLLTQSKFGIIEATRRSLPVEKGTRKLLDLDRAYSISRFAIESEKQLVIFNVHLSAYTKDGTISTEQLKLIAEDLKKEQEKGNYVICGGDFNKDLIGNSSEIFNVPSKETSWNQKIDEKIIPDGFTLVKPYNKENPIPSCRDTEEGYEKGKTYTVTLDGFIVSNNIEVVESNVIDTNFMYSDHNPVFLKFKMK